MNRYTVIREKMTQGLQAKTGWGRNEVLALLDSVLLATAEEELSEPKPKEFNPAWDTLGPSPVRLPDPGDPPLTTTQVEITRGLSASIFDTAPPW